ncbi:hypothetical protein NHX12_000940 [Muraenolepis orangiensis]|uniref:Uncharacterized protein n=1 Tax=Muraenolepis orangiensis TaxID=630683 RepID=A0A9Q0DZZ2_9TELE|nr:hypothetical protein NHX12_000940 [Muraenolepis orangiensis]
MRLYDKPLGFHFCIEFMDTESQQQTIVMVTNCIPYTALQPTTTRPVRDPHRIRIMFQFFACKNTFVNRVLYYHPTEQVDTSKHVRDTGSAGPRGWERTGSSLLGTGAAVEEGERERDHCAAGREAYTSTSSDRNGLELTPVSRAVYSFQVA